MKLKTEKDFVAEQLYDELDIELSKLLEENKDIVGNNEIADVEEFEQIIIRIEFYVSVHKALMKIDFDLDTFSALLKIEESEHKLIKALTEKNIEQIGMINIHNEEQMCYILKNQLCMLGILYNEK